MRTIKLKEILEKIKSKPTLIILAMVFIIIWFILPHIKIGGSHPFNSKTSRIIILLLSIISISFKEITKVISKCNVGGKTIIYSRIKGFFSNIKPHTSSIRVKITRAFSKIKPWIDQKNDRRQLKKRPLFIVLGAEQSGKKSLIFNSDSNILTKESMNSHMQEIKNQLEYQSILFTSNSTFIIDKNISQIETKKSFKKLIKHIKRNRKTKPLNGIIVTISLGDLLTNTHDERLNQINTIAAKIKTLNSSLNCATPVYIVLTKTDNIAGFTEFFNDLSQEELTQIWGITFNIENCSDCKTVLNEFNNEYVSLIQRLEKKVLFTLETEKNQEKRSLIQTFPQQIHLFKKPILTLISELFNALNKTKILLRGVYLTSSQQNHKTIDYLYSTTSDQYNLIPDYQIESTSRNEPYFISALFYSVILEEGKLLGENLKIKRTKKICRNISMLLAPIITVFTMFSLTHAYENNSKLIKKTYNNTLLYNTTISKLNRNNPSLSATLPAMQILKSSYNSTNQATFFDKMMLTRYKLIKNTHNALIRGIHSIYIPRIASNIESELIQSENKDPKNLYVLLKAYLAFNANHRPDNNTIITSLENQWSQNKRLSLKQVDQLKYYSKLAVQQKLDALPLSNPLIKRIKVKLELVNPTQRAYALLIAKSTSNQTPPIEIASTFGQNNTVYSFSELNNKAINGLYTAQGFNNDYLASHREIAERVANDNQIIGLSRGASQTSADIDQQLASLYQVNYSQQWASIVNSIIIKHADTDNALSQQLKELGNLNSDFKTALTVIANNTKSINTSNIKIANEFSSINEFMNTNNQYNYSKLETISAQLSQYINTIKNSSNPDLGYFNAARDYINNDTKNPIVELAQLEQNSPQPIQRWLKVIENNVWHNISNHAVDYIQKQWQSTLEVGYNHDIASHYPFLMTAKTQASIDDFKQYFQNKGKINNFYNKFIKAFVNDSDQSNWQLKKVFHNQLNLSTDIIKFFQISNNITKQYFNNDNSIGMKIILTPLTLSEKAKSININVGNEHMNYQHGPQTPVTFDWPNNSANSSAMITINNFNDDNNGLNAYGYWALYKILNNPNVNLSTVKDHINMIINIDGYYATMRLDSNKTLSNLTLAPFQLLTTPETFRSNSNVHA
jgi:type VI secretion system protein ImpL